MNGIRVSPSILSADFANLQKEIKEVEKAGAVMLHLDIMDGHFVPNISFGPVVVKAVRRVTDLELWSHLMIEEPEKYIDPFISAGTDGIVIHCELNIDHRNILKKVKQKSVKCGISINPETDAEKIRHLLPEIDRILVMSVHPGFGGQKFIPESLNKITAIRKMADMCQAPPLIEVDGGVNAENAGKIIKAGADILVAGSSVFKHPEGIIQGIKAIESSIQAEN